MKLEVGGVANQLLELLPNFENIEDLNISLVTKYSEYIPKSKKLIIYTHHKFKNSKLDTLYFNLKSFFKIIGINKSRKIHIILVFKYVIITLFTPYLLNKLFKIPILIITPTDFDTHHREALFSNQNPGIFKLIYYGWFKYLQKVIFKKENIYIQAINRKIYNDLLNLNCKKENIVLIPNGISISKYLYIKKIKHKETNFGFVGRLIKTKNVRLLIKAFKDYIIYYPLDKLLIFGKGPEENFISNYIKRYNLEDNIKIIGFEKDKNKIYSQIDVLIHPSYGEGVPMTILEGILTNTFIIASNVNGNRDIISHKETGLLFNPFNKENLIKQMISYKNNKDLVSKILNNTKNKIISNYDIKVIISSLYQFLISKLS